MYTSAWFKKIRKQSLCPLFVVSTAAPAPRLRKGEIRHVREHLGVSQAVFAYMLRVNPRTLQRWEQGQNKPNDQAIVLIRLVEEHPEVLRHLETMSA
ncbi:MAG: type II toxin-antitoxin system MqsA family antitoxin [Planctomycetota bacterium]